MRTHLYMDNAATSWPKAPGVGEAMAGFLQEGAGSPGRGGHAMALQAGRELYSCRRQLAALFGVADASRIVFTVNATQAINMALFGALNPGDHCVTTSMEHNAVSRPLHALARRGVEVTVVPCDGGGLLDPAAVRSALRPNSKLVAMTHASNVCGTVLPVREVAAITREAGVLLLVDAAQTAGVLPIDAERWGIDMLAAPGHKSLLGPSGTGFLYVREGVELSPLLYGGTGSLSEEQDMPPVWPDRMESGTLNAVGVVGLSHALAFIAQRGISALHAPLDQSVASLRARLATIPSLKLYGHGTQVPMVACNVGSLGSTEVAHILDSSFGIAVRAGLHCAPWAHRTLGTTEQGIVRISPGPFSTEAELDSVAEAIEAIAKGKY